MEGAGLDSGLQKVERKWRKAGFKTTGRRWSWRQTHPHHRGGRRRGGIACRNPVVKSSHTHIHSLTHTHARALKDRRTQTGGKDALRGRCAARFTKDHFEGIAAEGTRGETLRTSCDFKAKSDWR